MLISYNYQPYNIKLGQDIVKTKLRVVKNVDVENEKPFIKVIFQFIPVEKRRKIPEYFIDVLFMDVNQIITPLKSVIVCFNFLEI